MHQAARRLLTLPSLVATLALAACSSGGAARGTRTPPPAYGYPPSAMPAVSQAFTGYRLPVIGTWRVQRTHYGNQRDQGYAIDLLMPTPEGRNHAANGKQNTDWPSFDQPIVADAPGVIAVVVDGVPNNEPPMVNSYDQHGNYVIIDHRNGEYSLMAHLIPGSMRVRVGQVVTQGQELGRCGNSGHTTNPHLHWQVMDNVNPQIAQAVAPRYLPYSRNGVLTTELPDKGDVIVAP
jgi:murein DD-endopeptidase MepM/ murein hydrolase activator NlpD